LEWPLSAPLFFWRELCGLVVVVKGHQPNLLLREKEVVDKFATRFFAFTMLRSVQRSFGNRLVTSVYSELVRSAGQSDVFYSSSQNGG
jgi:hypothetical protein